MSAKQKKDTPQREHDRWAAQRLAARRDYDKFVKVRAKLHEADVERKRQIKTVADFLKQVLPPTTTTTSSAQRDASHSQTEHGPPVKPDPPPRASPTKRRRLEYKTPTSREVVCETPTPQRLSIKRDGDDDDDVSTDDLRVEPEVIDYGASRVGALASPYVSPYLYETKK